VNSKIDATDNYLARYLPFNQFVQMLEVSKVVIPDIMTNKKLRENVENYEFHKTRQLYESILFDDGLAPKQFSKDHLLVGRDQINELLQRDAKLNNKNLRSIKSGKLSIERHKEARNKHEQCKIKKDLASATGGQDEGKGGIPDQHQNQTGENSKIEQSDLAAGNENQANRNQSKSEQAATPMMMRTPTMTGPHMSSKATSELNYGIQDVVRGDKEMARQVILEARK